MNRSRIAVTASCAAFILCPALLLSGELQAKQTQHQRMEKLSPPVWKAPSFKAKAGQSLMLTGRMLDVLEINTGATYAYLMAAYLLEPMRDFLHTKAAQTYIKAPKNAVLSIWLQTGPVITKPIKGAGLTRAKLITHIKPDAPLTFTDAQQAINNGPRATSCTWIIDRLGLSQKTTLAAFKRDHPTNHQQWIHLLHGACLLNKYQSPVTHFKTKIDGASRLKRADLLFKQVRFYLTKAQLDQIDPTTLNTEQKCHYWFRTARTYYRIRKLRNDSTKHYLKVAALCKKQASLRKKSLYGAGKRLYETKKSADAAKIYTTLLNEYPTSRYADDARYYLAKIARRAGKKQKEIQLLRQAINKTPDGDMIFEMAWETFENLLRQKKYAAFIRAINGLKLPPQDNNYFSQGRLSYFMATAHEQLKQGKKARTLYRTTFKKYPFSFYGYLSWTRLKQLNVTLPIAAKNQNNTLLPWFPKDWGKSNAALLYHSGLRRWAAQVEHAGLPKTPTHADLWRLAFLYDRAKRYPTSHNIARRRIKGRPWAHPAQNQTLRWTIAWPNPFAKEMKTAYAAERKQHKKLKVSSALALAIMREESSFVPTIESYAGALGLMQLMPTTALGHDKDIKGKATPKQLKKPKINIRVGLDHIYLLANRLEQHPVLMVSAYNAGAGAVRRWMRKAKTKDLALFVEDIPSYQTRNYTKRVIGSYFAYQWLIGEKRFDQRVLNKATIKGL